MCVSCSRRRFLGGSIASLFVAPAAWAETITTTGGCTYSPGEETKVEIRSTSGDPNLDEALIVELQKILTVIPKINPGFQYMVDVNPNSFATTDTILPGTQGTVLIGLNLIKLLMGQPEGGAAVAGMCAHECGHIYQYNTGFHKRLGQVLLTELHADFLAGIYMGKRKEFTADRVRQFSDALHGAGDYAYGDPSYHGTPGQRSAAMEKGYQLSSTGKSFDDLAAIGETYVRNLA